MTGPQKDFVLNTSRKFAELLDELDDDSARRAQLARTLNGQPAYWLEDLLVRSGLAGQPSELQDRMRLIAGLYGLFNRGSKKLTASDGRSIGTLMGDLFAENGSPSTEHRFLNLLSTDAEGLPHTLRQIGSLLTSRGISIDYARLALDLWFWNDRTKRAWAQDFYTVTTRPPRTAEDQTGPQNAARIPQEDRS